LSIFLRCRLSQLCGKVTGRIPLGITETFAKSYDGSKAIVGPLEIQVDEASIASATGMPRIGKKWFKTTVTKNLDFRPYLKPEFQDITWNMEIPTSYLEATGSSQIHTIIHNCIRKVSQGHVVSFKVDGIIYR
jgi:hypothetical protein